MNCQHSKICGACPWIELSYVEQKERKLQQLRDKFKTCEIHFHFIAEMHIRDRVDLISSRGKYGFYQKSSRDVFMIEECPQMSPELFDFFQDLKKIEIPINKGSLRLRVSPGHQRGLWLDFANEDIKNLFAEEKTLQQLKELAFVEIGQRRKKLVWDNEGFRLQKPEFHSWTRTWLKAQDLDLYSAVGSFSQTGHLANRHLIQVLTGLLQNSEGDHWLEFGCGNGNLTFPLADLKAHVTALEFDSLALEGFQQSLKQHRRFEDKISLIGGDFQRAKSIDFSRYQGVLVNPPRSGLQDFLKPMIELSLAQKPKSFIYMSCFMNSFIEDAQRLEALGYHLQNLHLIDQFPQSPHFEMLSHWGLN